MNIAELFIKLGVKGGKDSSKEVTAINKSLGEAKSQGLAAKAAIVGVVFGLQRLMSNSAATGAELNHFVNNTNLSTKALQKWQGAGRKANISAEEVQNAFESVQAAVAGTELGETPRALAIMASTLGDFDNTRLKDTFYLMGKIQEFSQKTSAPIAQKFLSGLGISRNMIGAMTKNVFNAKAMMDSGGFTDREIKNLAKINSAWTEIFFRLETSIGKIVASKGLDLVKPLTEAAVAMSKLTETFVIFLEKSEAVKKIAESISLISKGAQFIVGTETEKGGLSKASESSDRLFRGIIRRVGSDVDSTMKSILNSVGLDSKIDKAAIRPTRERNPNYIFNNKISIIESDSPKATAKELTKEINKTYRAKAGGLGE